MLNSNDSAKVIKLVASDLIKREMAEIVHSMDSEAKMTFVNSVRSLNEISSEIEKSAVVNDSDEDLSDSGLLMITTGP